MSITCPSCLAINEDTATSCFTCGTPLQADKSQSHNIISPHHLPPQTCLKENRYQIEKTLGEGGFGITYKGWDCQASKTIAIKELWPEKSVREGLNITWSYNIQPKKRIEQVLKFQLEGKFQSQCKHPNICQVYDWFEENNTAYIVMEFISGETLAKILQKEKFLTEAKTKRYFLEVAEALAVIHNNNLLHRDIKPDNILIDGNDQAIIIDFGATKEFIAGQTREMSVTLTQGYAPLEQYSYRGKRWPATDIYALCASMYEMLTGQLPTAAIERLQQINNNNVDGLISPRQLVPNLSPLMEKVILTGMNLKVENRFQNAEELIKALKGNVATSVKLVCKVPNAPISEFPLEEKSAIIGVFNSNSSPIDIDLQPFPGSDTVSRQHAEIYQENGVWKIQDLGSTNGIFLKPSGQRRFGARITQPEVLNIGDEIAIAKIRFLFQTA